MSRTIELTQELVRCESAGKLKMSRTIELTQQLVRCESVTPVDGGCQKIIADRLTPLGFKHSHRG